MKALVALSLCALMLAGIATEALAAGTHRTWVRRFALSPPLLEPEGACLAANGSVSMCGTHEVSQAPVVDFDGFVATYRRDGSRWKRTYRRDPGTPAIDVFRDIAGDRYGNVYVCGYVGSTAGPSDVLLVKYSRSGVLRWSLLYDHENAGLPDAAETIFVTPGGTVYLAGETAAIPFATRGWPVLKVSPGGAVRWSHVYVGPVGDDSATSLARDTRGNILVSGVSRSPNGDNDCVTVCLDRRNGERLWPTEARFARPGQEGDPTVVANPRGGCFVALESDLGGGNGDDVVLLCYGATGKRRWARRYDGPDHGAENISDVAVDAAANVYIAGTSQRIVGPASSALAIRYTRGGARRWTKLFRDLKQGREASFYGVAIDAWQRPYFAGSVGQAAATNALLRAYTRAGKLRWRDEYDSPFRHQDAFYSVKAWRDSAVYGCGVAYVGVTPPNVRGLVIRYRP